MSELPRFGDLPVVGGQRASWGLWADRGDGVDPDVFGCLNLLTPERLVAAAGQVQRGAVFALNWTMDLPDPPMFGRSAGRHEVLSERGHQDDVLHDWNTQSSSQWDGFRHIWNEPNGFYGGLPDEEHGVHHWARRGIAGRAVVCDVARYRAASGRPIRHDACDAIQPEEVTGALAAQGTTVEPGDVLLLHTGWIAWYEGQDADTRAALAERSGMRWPGLAPGERSAELLWDLHIAAVAADNPSVEAWPPGHGADPDLVEQIRTGDRTRMGEIFTHTLYLPMLGLPLGEMFVLSPLADDCAADGRYTCLFTSAPLNLSNGVASPPNALAIK
jgi:kynurenine formamidase